jgi:hypothetical protein
MVGRRNAAEGVVLLSAGALNRNPNSQKPNPKELQVTKEGRFPNRPLFRSRFAVRSESGRRLWAATYRGTKAPPTLASPTGRRLQKKRAVWKAPLLVVPKACPPWRVALGNEVDRVPRRRDRSIGLPRRHNSLIGGAADPPSSIPHPPSAPSAMFQVP